MIDICACCGQKIRKLNPHRMCKQKVDLLQMLFRAKDWVFVQAGYGVEINGKVWFGRTWPCSVW